jgi:uncharacterized protein (TIGR03086 family)
MDGTIAAVELLERAIGYTRGTLVTITADHLDRPTPCSEWRLRHLLDHMADSLDAFTEASGGLVPITVVPVRGTPVDVLKEKACTLLGAWSSPAAETVWLDDARLDAALLLRAGALEIVLHGWDVGQATGVGVPLPEGLATELLPVALELVTDADRGVRFGPELPAADASTGARILGFSGRQPLLPQELRSELG